MRKPTFDAIDGTAIHGSEVKVRQPDKHGSTFTTEDPKP